MNHPTVKCASAVSIVLFASFTLAVATAQPDPEAIGVFQSHGDVGTVLHAGAVQFDSAKRRASGQRHKPKSLRMRLCGCGAQHQVEQWFAKIEPGVIARGVFTSVPDLARKLRRCINVYSARPIRWK